MMPFRTEFEKYFGKKTWDLQRNAYGKFLEAWGKNPRMVVFDADLSKSTQTCKFQAKYPDRFFNVGIAEANMFSQAAGASMEGLIPFASTFAVFAVGKGYEQIRQSIAYSKAPVKIIATHRGCFTGQDGYSHHCLTDIALMRTIPEINIAIPCDAVEAKTILEKIIEDGKSWYVGLVRGELPTILDHEYFFNGKIKEVYSKGKDVLIFSNSSTLYTSMTAAKILEENGLAKTSVYNVSCIRPFDKKGVEEVAKNSDLIVTVEDHCKAGGLNELISSVLIHTGIKTRQVVIAVEGFTHSGNPEEVYTKFGLSPGRIYHKIKENL